MSDNVDVFLEHYGVKGMTRKSSLPEKLTRIARVASGTESTNKNFQKALKEKLKKINDAIKEQKKKQKEYEDALKELDDSKDEEPNEPSSEFIKKHAVTSVKDFESTEDEPATTSNE